TGSFGRRVALNMASDNLQRYEAYYQFNDPMTPRLQWRREPTRVTDVMPLPEMLASEFFNDFLHRDGLYWGANLYAWDGDDNLGDIRIWRARGRGNFERHEMDLLALIRPAFTAALRRCRDAEPAAPAGLPAVPPAVPPAHRDPATPGDALRSTSWRLLSPRERDVAALAARGLADKEIAAALGVSFSTVRTLLGRAFRKLGVDNRVKLPRVADAGEAGDAGAAGPPARPARPSSRSAAGSPLSTTLPTRDPAAPP
ncbi:MAG: response regulator transcription factor, partial [Lautropia sp.]